MNDALPCGAEALVGLERTLYNVSEGVGIIEVCAVVFQPTTDCPITSAFSVALVTRDGSAGTTPTVYTSPSFFMACVCVML